MFPNKDEVAMQSPIYKTTNYAQFKQLTGNRPLREDRVRRLSNLMKKNGNLMQFCPVQVNEHKQVIDGQHRIAAAEINKFPVFYEIKEGGNLGITRDMNSGMNNWNWLDWAESYAAEGNEDYKTFLKVYNESNLHFSVVHTYFLNVESTRFNGSTRTGKYTTAFVEGTFKANKSNVVRMYLNQFREMSAITGCTVRNFAYAALQMMRRSEYDHAIMLNKLATTFDPLRHCVSIEEFIFALEKLQ